MTQTSFTEITCLSISRANKLFDRGLGALTAEKFAAEGSNIAINYMSNKETADKLAADIASKHGVKTVVIQGVWLFIPGMILDTWQLETLTWP
jgi:NAD(P)-dependent dehydrogenase (short-subunit alcohol dehydrogenase family)